MQLNSPPSREIQTSVFSDKVMMNKAFIITFNSTVVVTSITLGAIYSKFNSDFHHWAFILGTTLDFIDGKILFVDTYVQYGPGLSLLFYVLGLFVDINYTSLGVTTSIAYSLILLILSISIANITSWRFALFFGLVAFLIHPYAFYPWPDYYSGLSIALAVYFLIKRCNLNENVFGVIAGLFLMVAFIIRTTFGFSILASIVLFYVMSLMTNTKIPKRLAIAMFTFIGLGLAYLFFLFHQDVIYLFYRQSIGAAGTTYGVGWKHVVYLLINMISPRESIYICFSMMYLFSLMMLFRNFITQTGSNPQGTDSSQVIVFLAILGLCGCLQALKHYEVFRLQTACFPLYVVVAFFFYQRLMGKQIKEFSPFLLGALVGLVMMLVVKFPFQLMGRQVTLFPLVQFERDSAGKLALPNYREIDKIPALKGHALEEGLHSYYTRLEFLLCRDERKILNLTGDSLLPYICSVAKNASKIPFYDDQLLDNIDSNERRRIKEGHFYSNEIVVTQLARTEPWLKLRGTVLRPNSFRWLGEGLVFVYDVEPYHSEGFY